MSFILHDKDVTHYDDVFNSRSTYSRCARKKKQEDNVHDNEARLESIIYSEQELPNQLARSKFCDQGKKVRKQNLYLFSSLVLLDNAEKCLLALHLSCLSCMFKRFPSSMTRRNTNKVVKHNDKASILPESHYFLIARFFDQRNNVTFEIRYGAFERNEISC